MKKAKKQPVFLITKDHRDEVIENISIIVGSLNLLKKKYKSYKTADQLHMKDINNMLVDDEFFTNVGDVDAATINKLIQKKKKIKRGGSFWRNR